MKISEATALLNTSFVEWRWPQAWCDLGCGSGIFTKALAELLSPGSVIHAIDINQIALNEIPNEYNQVAIRKIHGDIASPGLRIPEVDGVLMANSLHFVRDQHLLLNRLISVANRFLIVEYERSRPHMWVPFPVGFEKLQQLFGEVGAEFVKR